MKKILKLISATVVITVTAVLAGCSCGGDIYNTCTNFGGCVLENCASCGDCATDSCAKCTNCFIGWSTCFLCFNSSIKDSYTCWSCHQSAEDCKSDTKTSDTETIDEELYSRDSKAFVWNIKTIAEPIDDCKYMKITGSVTVRFSKSGVKYDNVSVVCKLTYSSNKSVTSTRWVGTMKSGKGYTVEPEFYVKLNSDELNRGDYRNTDYYTLTYYLIGQEA